MRGTRSFENTGAFAGSVQRIVRFASVALALFAFLAAMTISGFVPQVMAADPVHIHLDHWANGGSPQTAKKWVDGNLHWTNSHYAEGDADPVRFIMDNLRPGTTYTLQFSWLTTKKQGNGGTSVKHAHDFLANYTFSEFPAYTPTVGVPPSGSVFSYPGTTTSYPDPCLPRVQGGYKLPYVCAPASAPTSIFEVPADNILGTKANQLFLGGRQIRPQYLSMWNGAINAVSVYTYSPSTNPFNGTGYNSLTVTFTTSAGWAGPDGVVLAFGGHLAKAADWGNGQGAGDINGAPYHWSYVVVDQSGARVAGGNRDRSIMVIRKGSIEVKKVCTPDDSSSGFLFTSTQPSGVDGLPSSFNLDCNTSQGAIIEGGSGAYSITESPLPGFAVTNISCARYGADGSSLGPASGLAISPALPVAYPGSVTVSFSFNAGDNVICTFTNTKPDARIYLNPPTATNEVGQPHEIIATVQQNDGAGGFVAAAGKLVTFSLPSNPPGALFVGGNTCTTDANGHCSVFINSNNTGTVTIHATTTFSVLGVSLTRSTNDGVSGDGPDVEKIYVDGYIGIQPSAVNEVRNPHTFTITVTQVPDGAKTPAATANITWSVSPAPSSSSSDCGPAVPFSGNAATCYVTINSPTPGVFIASATAVFTIDGVTLTRTTDGKGSNSGTATKTYVDANINLSPLTATNEVGYPHTITATVRQNDGTSGFVAAVGKAVTFSLPSNPPSALFVGGNTCTTDASGQCAVTINSNNPGTVVIHATTTFSVLGLSLTRASNDSLPGDGPDVKKIYVGGYIGIRPDAVNEVRNPHTFTITVTQVADGAITPAATANITWSISPTPASSSSNCGPAVPFSGNVATCNVTINSPTAGVFTITATAVFTIDSETLTCITDGKGSDSGPATKTYVDANINLSPLTATNEVGDRHEIIATVKQNDGTSGFVAAVGKLVTFSLPSNPPGAFFVGGNTCTTDTEGHCSVFINSNNPGTVVIHGATTFEVLGVSLTRSTNDGLPGDGPDVNKIYHSSPAIAVTKTCVSATSGSTITFFGTITNTGDTDLSGIQLFDNQPAPNTPVPLTQTALAIGQSVDYTGSYNATSSPSTDTVTVFARETFTGRPTSANSLPQTCTIPLPTRTLGFWATHTAFANAVWTPQPLCTANNITDVAQPGKNQLMGGFWSDVSKNSNGSSRSALSQARLQLLQQYFAAVLNYRYFKSGSLSQLDSARSAYCGTDVNTILSYVGILDKFNQSGDNKGDTTAAGNSTSQDSQTQANIPFWNDPSFR